MTVEEARRARKKAYNKAYSQAHREEAKAKSKTYHLAHQKEAKAYRQAHQEKQKAYQQAYRPAHREGANARNKAYYQAHREKVKASSKAYYLAHPEKQKAWGKAYRLAHPAEEKMRTLKRRAHKRGAAVGPVDLGFVQVRDRMICQVCHKKVKPSELSYDHIVPLSKGGPHITSNLQVAHRRCNLARGTRGPAQMRLKESKG